MSTTPPQVTYLRSLNAIRDRCAQVFQLAEKAKLDHWDFHPENLRVLVDFCAGIIQVSDWYHIICSVGFC